MDFRPPFVRRTQNTTRRSKLHFLNQFIFHPVYFNKYEHLSLSRLSISTFWTLRTYYRYNRKEKADTSQEQWQKPQEQRNKSQEQWQTSQEQWHKSQEQ